MYALPPGGDFREQDQRCIGAALIRHKRVMQVQGLLQGDFI